MDNNKNKSSIGKSEEFFSSVYKNETFEVLEQYPNERSLFVSFNKLKDFDSDLACLLIEKPDDVLFALAKAIKNIDPLMKDADLNIRIKNIPFNIPIKNLDSRKIGKLICTEGIIKEVKKPYPRINIGIFECKTCMRLHEVEQTKINTIIEPSMCPECGGRSFGFLPEESIYVDTQILRIKGYETSREILFILEDESVDYDAYNVNDLIKVNGILKLFEKKNEGLEEYIDVNYIEKCQGDSSIFENELFDLENENTRNSPEYNKWVNDILSRDDSTCLVCGERRAPHVHHIFSFKNHPDYRLNEDNGVVLCRWCHHKYHDIYGKSSANPVSLIKFLKEEQS